MSYNENAITAAMARSFRFKKLSGTNEAKITLADSYYKIYFKGDTYLVTAEILNNQIIKVTSTDTRAIINDTPYTFYLGIPEDKNHIIFHDDNLDTVYVEYSSNKFTIEFTTDTVNTSGEDAPVEEPAEEEVQETSAEEPQEETEAEEEPVVDKVPVFEFNKTYFETPIYLTQKTSIYSLDASKADISNATFDTINLGYWHINADAGFNSITLSYGSSSN